jgi:hypothetical protein
MLRVYNRVADSGDVVMQKRDLSIVDTRVPEIATTPAPFSRRNEKNPDIDICPHINRILSGGRHLGGRRLSPPDLHHIESASRSRWEMIDGASARQKTYIDCTDVRDRLPSTSLRNPNDPGQGVAARVWCEDLMTGTLSSRAYIMTLL